MDISREPLLGVWIGTPMNPQWFCQGAIYETLSAYYMNCKIQGHNLKTCKKETHRSDPVSKNLKVGRKVKKVWVRQSRDLVIEEIYKDVGNNLIPSIEGTKVVPETLAGEVVVPDTLHVAQSSEPHVPVDAPEEPLNEDNITFPDLVARAQCEPNVLEECMVNNVETTYLSDMDTRDNKGKMVLEACVPSSPVLQENDDFSLNMEIHSQQVPTEGARIDSLVVELSRHAPIVDHDTALDDVQVCSDFESEVGLQSLSCDKDNMSNSSLLLGSIKKRKDIKRRGSTRVVSKPSHLDL